jgi:hypothetical protein
MPSNGGRSHKQRRHPNPTKSACKISVNHENFFMKSGSNKIKPVQRKLATLLIFSFCLGYHTESEAALIARLSFENSTNTTTLGQDSSGLGNHFTPNGTITSTTGVAGNAISLNGGKYTRDFGSSFDSKRLSISFWGRRNGTMDWRDWWAIGDSGAVPRGVVLENRGSGANQITLYNNPGGTAFAGFSSLETTAPTWAQGTWLHTTVTFDNPGNSLRIFVDGILRASATYSGNFPLNQVTFGGIFDDGTRNINGSLDDIQIYNHVISPAMVAYLAANPGTVAPEPTKITLLIAGLLPVMLRRKKSFITALF